VVPASVGHEDSGGCRDVGLRILIVLCVFAGFMAWPNHGSCQVYGIKDSHGGFVRKVNITMGPGEIVIKKVDPRDKFNSIALTINPRNTQFLRSVQDLRIEWINFQDKPTKPTNFVSPRYDANTRTYQDTMTSSTGLRIAEKSNRNLFQGKTLGDFFKIRIDGEPIIPADSFEERDRTVQLGSGRDVSLEIDRTSILFDENNYRKGEIVDVDNRSGAEQVLAVEVPESGLIFFQIRRKQDQSKVPKEEWNRFSIPTDSGVFIVLIPDPDPTHLAQLDGKSLIVKVLQGTRVRETRKIPIQVAEELRASARRPEPRPTRTQDMPRPAAAVQEPQGPKIGQMEPPAGTAKSGGGSAGDQNAGASRIGGWKYLLLPIFTLFVLAGVVAYGLFFLLPRIQVLEDRLTKAEMFVHGSREAIREELEQIKEELAQPCPKDPESP
jgi:hypothetical protein